MHAERYIEMQRGYLFDEHLVVCEYSVYCVCVLCVSWERKTE